MDNICCIIDMNGFNVKITKNNGVSYKSEFFIRELGYVRVGKGEKFPAKSCMFNLRGHLSESICMDVKTLRFQSTKIMGLPIFSTQNESAEDYNKKLEIIKKVYDECRQEGLDVVAYKGGSWEKKYLQELDIPCINLEDLGCPKFKDLLGNGSIRSLECGHHILAKNEGFQCSQAQVAAYRDWLVDQTCEE